jgi:hypothetical protein
VRFQNAITFLASFFRHAEKMQKEKNTVLAKIGKFTIPLKETKNSSKLHHSIDWH